MSYCDFFGRILHFIFSNSRSSVYLYTAVDNDGSEDVKPPDSKRFQLETDEVVGKIRETEAKIVRLPLVALLDFFLISI